MTYNSKLLFTCALGAKIGGLVGLVAAAIYNEDHEETNSEMKSALFVSSILMGIGIGGLFAFWLYFCFSDENAAEYDEIESEDSVLGFNY